MVSYIGDSILQECPKPLPTGGRWLSPGNLTRFPDEGKM
jgi:hypothetical protein